MKKSIAAFGSEPPRSPLRSFAVSMALALSAAVAPLAVSSADQNGVSFWLPGLFQQSRCRPWYVCSIVNVNSLFPKHGGASVAKIARI
jgi:hypothetical protein